MTIHGTVTPFMYEMCVEPVVINFGRTLIILVQFIFNNKMSPFGLTPCAYMCSFISSVQDKLHPYLIMKSLMMKTAEQVGQDKGNFQ